MASQQQPPARPWFRLASMSRPAAPAAAPVPAPQAAQPPSAPQPRPEFIRPTFATQPPPPPATTSSLPPSPTQNASPASTTTIASSSLPPSPKLITSAPSSSLPTSPVQKPVAPPPPTATISSVPTSPVIKFSPSPKTSPTSTTLPISSSSVPPSPKQIIAAPKPVSPSPAPPPSPATTTTFFTRLPTPTINSKPLAPASPPPPAKTKILTPPPSPLTLPSSQFKSDAETIEQKTVLVQETFEKPKVVPRHGGENHSPGIGLSGKRDVTKDNGYSKKLSSDSEEFGTRVITISGDNKGAIMELSQSPSSNKKKGSPKAWNDGEKSGSATSSGGEEGRVKGKDKNGKTMAATPLNTFMNSNVQGVNNSILFNTSCTHHDPGVHISLSRKANGTSGGGIHIKERKNGYNI